MQRQILLNFFNAIRQKYDDEWYSKTNAFNYASGFIGAVDFFRLRVMPYCNQKRSFRVEDISRIIDLQPAEVILQSEVKGLSGKDAQKRIYERLDQVFVPSLSTADDLLV